MAKKKPNFKNIRQGQTVYVIDWRVQYKEKVPPIVVSYLLYSHKTSLPPSHVVIEKLPVTLLKKTLKKHGNRNFFYTRNKAERYILQQMQCQLK